MSIRKDFRWHPTRPPARFVKSGFVQRRESWGYRVIILPVLPPQMLYVARRLSEAFLVPYLLKPEGDPGDETYGRMRSSQTAALARFSPAVMIASVFNAVVLMLSLAASEPASVLLAWCFAAIAYAMFVYLRLRSGRGRAAPRLRSRQAVIRAVVNAGVLGLIWGAVPVLFFENASTQLIVCCLAVGMMCAGCFVLATVPVAVAAFLAPMAAGISIALIRADDAGHYFLILLFASYVFVLLGGVAAHAAQFAARVLAQVDAERAAAIDALTGLPNRKGITERLDAATARLHRHSKGFAVLSIDLDAFKPVNDRFGHAAGDRLLIEVAQRLTACIREDDMLARIGGDEFVLLLADVGEPALAAEIAERLLVQFRTPFKVEAELVTVRASIGISLAPGDGHDAQAILACADSALYEVKRANKNGFRLFRAEDDLTVRKRKALSLDLRKAIERDELSVVYQPIVSVATGEVTAFEALLRWTHADQGAISPAEFIGLAEKSGLIHEIGEWVIDQACRAASELPPHVRMAVNFSLEQFRTANIVAVTLSALARYRLSAERFEIEVTESVLFEDDHVVREAIEALSHAGIRIVLDDFGTGFSSLRHFQDLPISGMKVDRSFVSNIATKPRSAAIIEAMIDLCRKTSIDIVAEGVETAEQLVVLGVMGCAQAQGFWIGRPTPAASLQDTVASRLLPGHSPPRLVQCDNLTLRASAADPELDETAWVTVLAA